MCDDACCFPNATPLCGHAERLCAVTPSSDLSERIVHVLVFDVVVRLPHLIRVITGLKSFTEASRHVIHNVKYILTVFRVAIQRNRNE